jgi:hypothetical protein
VPLIAFVVPYVVGSFWVPSVVYPVVCTVHYGCSFARSVTLFSFFVAFVVVVDCSALLRSLLFLLLFCTVLIVDWLLFAFHVARCVSHSPIVRFVDVERCCCVLHVFGRFCCYSLLRVSFDYRC